MTMSPSAGRALFILAALSFATSSAAQQRVPFRGDIPVAPTGIPVPPLPDEPVAYRTAEGQDILVRVWVRGLNRPWSIAFLPKGDALVTERGGRLRLIHDGVLDPNPVAGLPEVRAEGLSGLMDIALHPEFADNGLIYLTYNKPLDEERGVLALARGRWNGERLVGVEDIFVADSSGVSRIAFAGDGRLFMTTSGGDAQDPGSYAGKVLRLNDDGSVPSDNPFVGRAGYRPEIYTLGHRSPLGLAVHPGTGDVWESENGPNGGDELNILKPGANYGWPLISLGRTYPGPWQSEQFSRPGFENPIVYWTPSIAISGFTFYTGDALPRWKGDVFVGGLRTGEIPGTGQVQRVLFNENLDELRRESLLADWRQRVRDIRQGPDGLLYVLTDEADGAILRIEPAESAEAAQAFEVEAERFADLRVLRYRVPGFEELNLQQKRLLYYLYEAALSGREIIYDQKHRYNLAIKRTLEEIVKYYPGDRETEDFQALLVYLKRVWFSNGIHHHYSNDKFEPGFSYRSFARFVADTPGQFPLRPGQSKRELVDELRPFMFDADVDAKLVSRQAGTDVVAGSAVNFYAGVTQPEVEDFYASMRQPGDARPVSYGLNSRLVDVDGELVEQVYKIGGLYGEAIERVVYWLEQAVGVAENDSQRRALQELIRYYRSGDLSDWDDYNVAWVADTESSVDTINGFIEVYNDPIGLRGSFEGVVSFRDPVATRRIDAIAAEAQWFEDNSPIAERFKKTEVTGITGKVINVVVESGDSSPATPIGINLPNSDWIRRQHGSKSVSLANIVNAYELVRGAAEREFAWDEDEIARGEQYGEIVGLLTTDMHEVIGHASGQLAPGVGPLHETLGTYGSTLEEARADLVGLYYIIDPKLVELGLLPSVEAGQIAYDRYIRAGLMQQLYRIEPGNDIEEDHMRNRQMVAAWAYEHGRADNVIERLERDGKTYFKVRDYDKLRELFGELLAELQRIKSEGDFDAARELIETYGVKVDAELHAEVLERYAELDIPPYSGFINPRLVPIRQNGDIVDVRIEYPDDFSEQMLEYAAKYAFLRTWND